MAQTHASTSTSASPFHMTRRIFVLDPSAAAAATPSAGLRRHQPLLSKQRSSASSSSSPPPTTTAPSYVAHSKSTRRIAEVAGGTTAECAAVLCCCPCASIDLLVLALVKVPVQLCRRALRKEPRQRRAKLLQPKMSEEEEETWVHRCVTAGSWPEKSPSRMVSDMEEELWDAFCNTGFGRSPSQRSGSF